MEPMEQSQVITPVAKSTEELASSADQTPKVPASASTSLHDKMKASQPKSNSQPGMVSKESVIKAGALVESFASATRFEGATSSSSVPNSWGTDKTGPANPAMARRPSPPIVKPPSPPKGEGADGRVLLNSTVPANTSEEMNIVHTLVGSRVSVKAQVVEKESKPTLFSRAKAQAVKLATFGRRGGASTSSSTLLYREDHEEEEVEFDEEIDSRFDDQHLWSFDNYADSGSKSRVGVFETLNRSIDHSFGTSVCFLGGGKISCSGSYSRLVWEVGDVVPNYAIIVGGILRTFQVVQWSVVNSKKYSYMLLKYGQPYNPEGWVSFKASVNRRLLLKREDVEKGQLTFVKLASVSEFEDHAIFAIKDWVDPFHEDFKSKVKEGPPKPEIELVHAALRAAAKANRKADINYYHLPVEWLADPKSPPMVRDHISSLLPERRVKTPIVFRNEADRRAYFYAAAVRIGIEAAQEGDLRRCEIAQKVKQAYEQGSEEEKKTIDSWFDLFSSSECAEEVECRTGTKKMIHPNVPEIWDQKLKEPVSIDFEGLKYRFEAYDRGSYPLTFGHRLLIYGQSEHSRVLFDALQTTALETPIDVQRVEFNFYVDSTLRSVTTNRKRPEHGKHAFGEFWQEKCAYQGTYKGIWFRAAGNATDPKTDALVRVANNQLFAEFIHGCLQPDYQMLSNEPLPLLSLELTGKSVYFDSFEIDSSGQIIETPFFDISTEWPFSGEGRCYPWNLIEVMRKFPVRFEEGEPLVTIQGVDGPRDFLYEGRWNVDLYNPEVSADRNYEIMFVVDKADTGLQVLLGTTQSATKPATPDVTVKVEPLKVQPNAVPGRAKKEKQVHVNEDKESGVARTRSTQKHASTSKESKSESPTPDSSRSKPRPTFKSTMAKDGHVPKVGQTLPARLKPILDRQEQWHDYVVEHLDAIETWDKLCQKAQLSGKHKADLESDLFDYVNGSKTTARSGLERISKSAFELFLRLNPEEIQKNLTPLNRRKQGALPTQFTVEF